MADKKVTDIMLERIKYFVNAIENGEYDFTDYAFTISLSNGVHTVNIKDKHQLFDELN